MSWVRWKRLVKRDWRTFSTKPLRVSRKGHSSLFFPIWFIEPEVVRNCLEHLRFRKHDVAVFHLLEQRELALEFDRPMRFVDMEGGEPILADPTVIGAQYQRALEIYLEGMNEVIQDTEVDYHRIRINENYDDVLARFLLGRTPKRQF